MISLPPQVSRALALLNSAGHEAYLVGGAVRDYAMGKTPHDWDITTAALPEQTAAVFAHYRLIETGIQHGTVTVLLDGEPLEITTYRVDGAYTDHRRPDSVRFTPSLKQDLARRDFTINAMAYHPAVGVVDPFGGLQDLQYGLVRCVGEPARRFGEDGLRLVRALRFASVLDMRLEPGTAKAVHECRENLRPIAAERVHTELTKLLCGTNAESVLLQYRDVLAVPMPEIAPMFDFAQHNPHHNRDVWAHTAAVTAAIPPEPVLRWAAFLHDIGKPGCFSLAGDGVGHFYGHAQKSAELAEQILQRLRFDNASKAEVLKLIRYHDLPIQPETKQVKRLAGRLGVESLRRLIALHKADTMGQSDICAGRVAQYSLVEQVLDEILARQACFSLKDLAVNGRDVMALGLSGPAVGRALQSCLNAVMEEKLPNQKQALLAYIQKSM